ncbi:MAG TPA: hypothetical protein VHY79_03950 [Rhizomicrobium sp.]|jgi:hypothetical protein|nr:hypothetical protein [Rhizomicrobium sp.]
MREFRLSRRGRGVSCDSDGAFVGPVPLLKLSADGRWEPRDRAQLSKQLSSNYGVPVDLSSKVGGLRAIAKAFNEDDLARAQIATVLLCIPASELPADSDITWPVGRYVIPKNVNPGWDYGNLVHEQIGTLYQNTFPDVKMILRTSKGLNDVDIEIPDENVPSVGFRYAEIKPLSNSGFSRFKGQVARWKKPAPVLAITYDYDGNIYYGFPW